MYNDKKSINLGVVFIGLDSFYSFKVAFAASKIKLDFVTSFFAVSRTPMNAQRYHFSSNKILTTILRISLWNDII